MSTSAVDTSPGSNPSIELTVKEPRSYDASEEQEDDLQPLAHDNELEDVLRDGWLKYFHRSLSELLLGSKLNILMLLTPLALLAENFGWSDGVTFTLNLLAIAPFAERLGFVTEQLALHTNDTLVRRKSIVCWISLGSRSHLLCRGGC